MNERSFILHVTGCTFYFSKVKTVAMSPKTTPADKRAAILDATLKLLAAYGFHGFSMKRVADEAGVATGTVYLYFQDKEALIMALREEIFQRVAAHMFVGLTPEMAPFEQYRLICQNLWQFSTQNSDILLSKAQFDHLPPETLRVQNEDVRQHVQPLVTLFEQGKLNGILKPLPDEVLFSLGMEPYFALARQHLTRLVSLDEVCLEQTILASWDAIAIHT